MSDTNILISSSGHSLEKKALFHPDGGLLWELTMWTEEWMDGEKKKSFVPILRFILTLQKAAAMVNGKIQSVASL